MTTTPAPIAVGACPVCGYGIAVAGTTTRTTCPDCWTPVALAPVAGTPTAAACDDNCLYASRPECRCSCGGANHSRGYLNPAAVPAAIRARDVTRRVTVVGAREVRTEARRAALIAKTPELVALLGEEYADRADTASYRRALMTGTMTPSQVRHAVRVLASDRVYAAWLADGGLVGA